MFSCVNYEAGLGACEPCAIVRACVRARAYCKATSTRLGHGRLELLPIRGDDELGLCGIIRVGWDPFLMRTYTAFARRYAWPAPLAALSPLHLPVMLRLSRLRRAFGEERSSVRRKMPSKPWTTCGQAREVMDRCDIGGAMRAIIHGRHEEAALFRRPINTSHRRRWIALDP